MVRVLNIRSLLTAAAAALPLLLAAPARADVNKGADSFDSNCAECHSVAKTLKNKKGPSLYGIVGRTAATVPGFEYSDGMKAAGYAWDQARLDAYIAAPKKAVPGGKMKFDGLDDAAERADLIEFLQQQK